VPPKCTFHHVGEVPEAAQDPGVVVNAPTVTGELAELECDDCADAGIRSLIGQYKVKRLAAPTAIGSRRSWERLNRYWDQSPPERMVLLRAVPWRADCKTGTLRDRTRPEVCGIGLAVTTMRRGISAMEVARSLRATRSSKRHSSKGHCAVLNSTKNASWPFPPCSEGVGSSKNRGPAT